MKARIPTAVRLSLLAVATSLLTSAARADEFRLDDGRVVVGKAVEKETTWEVQTRAGLVIVPKNTIVTRRTDDELRAVLDDSRKNAGSTPFAHLQLAMDAHAYGLEPEMWRHLDLALRKQDDQAAMQTANAALQRRIEDFLAQLEPEVLPRKWQSASTEVRVHKLLDQVRVANKPAESAAIAELLVREPNAEQALRNEARRNSLESRRITALEALARRSQGQADHNRFVLRTAILDGHSDVREAAVRIAVTQDQVAADTVQYLAPGLSHSNAKVRVRTAEAFAGLAQTEQLQREALKQLVLAGPMAGKALAPSGGGQGTRGHVAILTQQAYIRDFDVEVAQAAFIADPQVDVLQSGTVLDVTVAGVFEERVIVRAYRQALKTLAKSDPGADPRAWAGWLNDLEVRRAAEAAPAVTPARK